METPPPIPPPNRPDWQLLLLGMVVGNAVGGALLSGISLLPGGLRDARDAVIWPSLILIPFIVGVVAAWFWRRLNRSLAISFLDALWTFLLSLALAAIVMREGVVCLVIASPLLYVFLLTGILLGRLWFRANDSKLRLTIFPLLALLTLGEALYHPSEKQAVVTDEVLIHATPDKVWPHVLAFSEIPDAPDYWIFRLGLPYPTETTNGGDFVGADRQCKFSDGIVIKERVAELVPQQKLTFDIIEQPTHPEAYGHITLHRGRFVLRDNRDGTTTLFGSSWYTLHVRPRWYFDLWTRDMTRAVHLRVMNHVRRLAEGAK